MRGDTKRRTLLRYAVAFDLVLLATGVALMYPGSPVVAFLAFTAAVGLAAWWTTETAGLLATALSAGTLAVLFRDGVDAGSLTAFTVAGAIISVTVTAVRRVRDEGITAGTAGTPPAALPPRTNIPFAIGLPLLIVIIYADLSEVAMKHYPVPSLLRPLIALLAIVVWRHRDIYRPLHSALHPATIFLLFHSLVIFTSGVWAINLRAVDARFSEVLKAVFICLLAASLSVTWNVLQRALAALVAVAASMAAISVVQIITGRFDDLVGGIVSLQEGNIYGDVSLPRASGPPVSDPNFYARILLAAIPMAIGLAIAEKRPLRRAAWLAAGLVVTAATLATYSRGAMLALAAMFVVMLVTFRVKAAHIAGMLVATAVIITVLPATVTQRFMTVESILPNGEETLRVDSSVAKRKLLLGTSLLMFDDHLLGGVGAGNFTEHYEDYADLVGMSGVDYGTVGDRQFPHALYAELGAENGLLGLGAFGLTSLAAFLGVSRARRRLLRRGDGSHAALATAVGIALFGYLVASLFLHESHIRYFGLYIGLAVAVSRLAASLDEAPPELAP